MLVLVGKIFCLHQKDFYGQLIRFAFHSERYSKVFWDQRWLLGFIGHSQFIWENIAMFSQINCIDIFGHKHQPTPVKTAWDFQKWQKLTNFIVNKNKQPWMGHEVNQADSLLVASIRTGVCLTKIICITNFWLWEDFSSEWGRVGSSWLLCTQIDLLCSA